MTPKTLLMTRPRDASERFVTRLSDAARDALDVKIAPLMDIVPTGNAVDLSSTDAALFTSGNGVRLGPEGNGRDAFCVGRRTGETALKRGWNVRHVAADAEGLITALSKGFAPRSTTHLAGTHRRGQIADRLAQQGWRIDVVELYDQRLCPLSTEAKTLLSGEAPVILPLFSPRTAAHLSKETRGAANAQIIALSEAVAAALDKGLSKQVRIVQAPTGDMMAQYVEMLALEP